jgi:hypothetical protein
MSKDCAPTIAPKILIGRFDDVNERCKASNQPNRLSALFPSMRPLQHVQRSTASRLDITQRYIYEQSDRSAAFASPIGLSHVCIKIDEGPLMPKAGSARAALILVALLAVAACGQDNRYAAPPPPKVTVAIPVEQEVSPIGVVTPLTCSA